MLRAIVIGQNIENFVVEERLIEGSLGLRILRDQRTPNPRASRGENIGRIATIGSKNGKNCLLRVDHNCLPATVGDIVRLE
jgi:hypothetical protein